MIELKTFNGSSITRELLRAQLRYDKLSLLEEAARTALGDRWEVGQDPRALRDTLEKRIWAAEKALALWDELEPER